MNAKIGLITILLLGVAMASSCGEPSENATSVEDAAKDVARSTPTDAVRSTEAAGKPDPGPSAEGSVMLGEGGIVRVTVLGHDAARTEQMGQDVEYCTGRVDEVVVGDLEVGDQIEIMCAVNPRDNRLVDHSPPPIGTQQFGALRIWDHYNDPENTENRWALEPLEISDDGVITIPRTTARPNTIALDTWRSLWTTQHGAGATTTTTP